MGRDLIVWGATCLNADAAGTVLPDAVIEIEKGRIQSLRSEPGYIPPGGVETLDCRDSIVLPGLVNGHTHSPMALFRGVAEGMRLEPWLSEIIRLEQQHLNRDFIYLGSLLACLEMIRSGTTTFNDMYYAEDLVARAAHETGLAAVCGPTFLEGHAQSQNFDEMDHFLRACQDFPLIEPSIAPHAIYSLTTDVFDKVIAYARDRKIRVHLHLSEQEDEMRLSQTKYGVTPTAYFRDLGLWELPAIAAHSVCLTEEDIQILGKARVGISHNPESNLKLGNKICPVVELIAAGAHVALGTDSAASNNNLDLLTEVDFAFKLQALKYGPGRFTNDQALRMLTIEGAKALRLEDRIGSLEVGKRADLIALDTSKPHAVPLYDPAAFVVSSANGRDVRHSVVNGKVLMQDYVIQSVDEKKILADARKLAQRIRV